LLTRLRDPADHAAWAEFEARYRDLLVRYCRRRGLQPADAEDVVQLVLTSLAHALPTFSYDRARGRFRDYLSRCAANAVSKWAERKSALSRPLDTNLAESLATHEPDPREAKVWEEEWVAHHYRLAMNTVRKSFDGKSVEIFDRSVGGAKPSELARVFEISEQAVHKIRQRIRDRMEELISRQVREEDALDERPV
jgi:RNA polymerase sigma factor (sigma-70 family)